MGVTCIICFAVLPKQPHTSREQPSGKESSEIVFSVFKRKQKLKSCVGQVTIFQEPNGFRYLKGRRFLFRGPIRELSHILAHRRTLHGRIRPCHVILKSKLEWRLQEYRSSHPALTTRHESWDFQDGNSLIRRNDPAEQLCGETCKMVSSITLLARSLTPRY